MAGGGGGDRKVSTVCARCEQSGREEGNSVEGETPFRFSSSLTAPKPQPMSRFPGHTASDCSGSWGCSAK